MVVEITRKLQDKSGYPAIIRPTWWAQFCCTGELRDWNAEELSPIVSAICIQRMFANIIPFCDLRGIDGFKASSNLGGYELAGRRGRLHFAFENHCHFSKVNHPGKRSKSKTNCLDSLLAWWRPSHCHWRKKITNIKNRTIDYQLRSGQ